MTYPTVVLEDAPLTYWRLGDAAGSTTAADASGNGNVGALDDVNSTPTASLIADPNPARLYSGPGAPSDLVVDSTSYGSMTGGSLEFWLNTTGSNLIALAGMVGSVSSSLVVYTEFPSPGDITVYLATVETPGVPVLLSVSGLNYNDGNTHHVVAAMGGGDLTLYFDGVSVGSTTYPGTETLNIDSQVVGEAVGASTFAMDEAAFYDHALSADRVALHYAEGTNPTPTAPPVLTTGETEIKPCSWRWEIERPTGTTIPWYPTVSGTLEFDASRDVPMTVSGLSSIGPESAKFESLQDRAKLYLVREGEDDVLMGTFYLSENTIQLEAMLEDNTIWDINHLGLGDTFIILRRSTGEAETIFSGSDPSQEMTRLLDEAGIPSSISGSAFSIQGEITWDGSETLASKIKQLAELAGHLSPWVSPQGIVRSEPVDFVERAILDLTFLSPEQGSLASTQRSLVAPNRVIVTGTEGTTGYPLRGQWDAPSIYLYSAAQRGYVLTQTVDVQGLQSSAHADEVARTIGLQSAAATLTFNIPPTDELLDPRLIRFRSYLWRVDSWSVSLTPNSRMSVSATLYSDRSEGDI